MNSKIKPHELFSDVEMGLIYSKEKSTFRVFSPPNKDLRLRIYDEAEAIVGKDYNMIKDENGIFHITVNGDLKDKFYTYITDGKSEVTDPYSISASQNSKKSAIIDLKETNPLGWENHRRPNIKVSEAIIYEMHIKDFTYSKNSNVKNRGKFLGVVESGTNLHGYSTGIDHLLEMGITHVHLMPIYDFLTVDEREEKFFEDKNYNWGYDPELFNVPEGSYSTKPNCPKNRIYELKTMIMKLHESGIKVVLDVVYNHVYRGKRSNFETLFPGYYLRYRYDGTLSNGAGVGTEMDTQRPMYRKFILDSVKYWMEEYKIDGFRFDLMGLIDIDTMESVVEMAKGIDEDVLIYGEPWTGGYTTLDDRKMVTKGSQMNKGYACFNDTFRDCIKGDNNGRGLGFVMGDFNKKICVEQGISGSISFDSLHKGFTFNPTESINYANSHDDLILTDKINLALRGADEFVRFDVNKLVHGILFTSFGIPFIHEGNEFLRSKNGISNTYNGPASLNEMNWSLKIQNNDFYQYVKDLIYLRKNITAFAKYDRIDIRKNLFFLDMKLNPMIGYVIVQEDEAYVIYHNASIKDIYVDPNIVLKSLSKDYKNRVSLENVEVTKIFDKNGLTNDFKEINIFDVVVKGLSTEVFYIKIKK